MKVLITGVNGQLGKQFKELSETNKDFVFTSREELDISKNEEVESFFNNNKFDCVINCASYTAVDKAENNINDSMNVNVLGSKNLAEATAKQKALLIHYSTDYVFDGKNNKPYSEDDISSPQTIYGKSKLKGEKEIFVNAERAIIIRTSWLYSKFGKNFVKTILEKSKEKQILEVVFDQIGSPTYCYDLANLTLKILPEVVDNFYTKDIYNFSNEGVASWYDIAQAIIDIKNVDCEVKPVLSDAFQTVAKRPYYSLLDKNKIKNDFNVKIPYWKHSLKRCLDEL